MSGTTRRPVLAQHRHEIADVAPEHTDLHPAVIALEVLAGGFGRSGNPLRLKLHGHVQASTGRVDSLDETPIEDAEVPISQAIAEEHEHRIGKCLADPRRDYVRRRD